ncbi:hypothetical protein KY290_025995 [Solanum tuberosum]|uniref:Uncharacterized protein n=1 Tax=Solanum tuberosum TaxID=4113 RepID=A0ABQ7UY98_SOLTU|nr:hypothetical protein KY289_025074 [Solanum tuberosum]KAH0673782.1 hypothetical protein KY284_024869 [Solanum tuberosum]KAH0677071.1 hypothetical protein KY285_024872 [Solanum tuberosum]KAH0755725.1 hypothetical protein KY290_025995 [Solanum tuberosum]
MSELWPLKVGQLAGNPSGNFKGILVFSLAISFEVILCVRLIFDHFSPILKEKELGFLRVKKRRRREEEEKKRRKEINKFPSWIFVGVIPIKGLYDSKCLLLEPLRWRGFRVGKKQGEKVGFLGEKDWAVAPASAPQKGVLNFPLGEEHLAGCPGVPFEVEGWRPAPLRVPMTPILPVTLIPHFFIHVPRFRYPGSASCTLLIQLSTTESMVSAELRKPGQGFAWGQKWSSGAGPAQGVGSGRDKLGIRAHSSRVLGSL